MVIVFFISIIALIAIILFAINPITRTVNNGIAKYNLAVKKRRLKEEEVERRKNKLETILKETEELRVEINDELRKQSAERFYKQSSVSTNRHEPIRMFSQDYYDWGLDEPVGLHRKSGWLD